MDLLNLGIAIPFLLVGIIRKTAQGYVIYSEKKDRNGKRKRLSRPYQSLTQAKKRLAQIEYFKHRG